MSRRSSWITAGYLSLTRRQPPNVLIKIGKNLYVADLEEVKNVIAGKQPFTRVLKHK